MRCKTEEEREAYRKYQRDYKRYRYATDQAFREKTLTKSRTYYDENRERALDRMHNYSAANKGKICEYNRNYRVAHHEEIREREHNYRRDRRGRDIQYKLAMAIRSRMHKAVRGAQKAGSAVRDLGCTIAELKEHIECKFQPGMAWDNWTINSWHIDHILPLASFDLTDKKQFEQACHYTNLQPLWAKENLSKGASI